MVFTFQDVKEENIEFDFEKNAEGVEAAAKKAIFTVELIPEDATHISVRYTASVDAGSSDGPCEEIIAEGNGVEPVAVMLTCSITKLQGQGQGQGPSPIDRSHFIIDIKAGRATDVSVQQFDSDAAGNAGALGNPTFEVVDDKVRVSTESISYLADVIVIMYSIHSGYLGPPGSQ